MDTSHGSRYFQIKKILTRVFARVRFEVEGLENLPIKGPAILVMNHTGWEEILFSILAVQRQVKFMGMRELVYLDDPISRARIFDTAYAKDFGRVRRGLTILLGDLLGGIVRRLALDFGYIPARVFTDAWRPVLGSNGIRESLQALRSGELVLMFPEGGYNRNGVMTPFKLGIGLLLRLLDRRGIQPPIIPAAQHTADSISLMLSNRYVPRLVVGSPLYLKPDDSSPRAFDESAARILQDQVNALLPQAWPDGPPQTYFLGPSPQLSHSGPDSRRIAGFGPGKDQV
jgi:1-acyl-sn-glycerol-3-phosphate acyltransferase